MQHCNNVLGFKCYILFNVAFSNAFNALTLHLVIFIKIQPNPFTPYSQKTHFNNKPATFSSLYIFLLQFNS